MSLGIRKNDLVLVRKGKDKGKRGRVLRVFPVQKRAIVEGVNLCKKHTRRRGEQQPSGIIEVAMPLSISNLSLWCSSCRRGVRFSVRRLEDKSKVRICKKCGSTL